MNVRLLVLGLTLAAGQTVAQGFAGLGQSAENFQLPAPNPTFRFPDDHGPHPAFRIEWWYLTANLTGDDGKTYGAQWTLFRNALAPETGEGWATPQIWMGHAGLTTETSHLSAERFARGGIGTAGVKASPFEAWIDDWTMTGPSLSDVTLTARGTEFSYRLHARANGPFVRQGDNGFSVKSPEGQSSYYYSQPFYQVSGEIVLPGGPVAVMGTAWLDREWSSQPLSANQTGWDWFALNLPAGEKLMAYRLRHADRTDYVVGSWITPDGTPDPLDQGDIIATPLARTPTDGGDVPTRWRIEVPKYDIDIEVEALNPNAWMSTSIAYWEGPVAFDGTHKGVGYLEMTGYDEE